jgi:hypothetical protein
MASLKLEVILLRSNSSMATIEVKSTCCQMRVLWFIERLHCSKIN